jgi:hypothetical protein
MVRIDTHKPHYFLALIYVSLPLKQTNSMCSFLLCLFLTLLPKEGSFFLFYP